MRWVGGLWLISGRRAEATVDRGPIPGPALALDLGPREHAVEIKATNEALLEVFVLEAKVSLIASAQSLAALRTGKLMLNAMIVIVVQTMDMIMIVAIMTISAQSRREMALLSSRGDEGEENSGPGSLAL